MMGIAQFAGMWKRAVVTAGVIGLMVFVSVLTFTTTPAWAEGSLEAATLEAQNATYVLTYNTNSANRTATITGLSGTASGDLVIPATITDNNVNYTVVAIADNAFKDQTGFTGAITLPNTLTSIGASAFKGCSNLKGPLTLPSSLTSLGSYAFSDCLKLSSSVTVPAGVTSIPDHCFYMSSDSRYEDELGITGIKFAAGSQLKSIGAYAFAGSWKTTGGITIPDSVESIGDYAFYYSYARMGSLSGDDDEPAGAEGTLQLSANLKTIGVGAFKNCSFSGNLVIPTSVTSIGDEAFCNAGFTGSLTLPINMTTISEKCFYDCCFTGSLTLPPALRTIGDEAFSGCYGFSSSLIIPDGVTQIGDNTFSGFGGKGASGSLTLPSELTSIGKWAFAGAGFSGALNIPDSVESIGESAFRGCRGFTSLKLPDNPNFTVIPDDAFCSGGNYSDPGMSFAGALTIPTSVTSIGENAFGYCDSFTSVTLSSNLTSIGDNAFDHCSGLTGTLNLPSNLETIGEKAFYFCESLTRLVISNGVMAIDDYAFYGCLSMGGDLVVPGSVKTIGEEAFCQFGSEKPDNVPAGALTIEFGVEAIGDSAFGSCNGFTSVTVPDSVSLSNMGSNVFEFSTGIESASLPDGWTAVPEGVFYGCSSLKQLEIPANATSIGKNAFNGCESLADDLVIPEGIIEIGDGAFSECTGFDGTITIPDTVTAIGGAAFYGCENLTGTLTIPNSVANLGSNWLGGIFQDCTGFTSLEMNQTCATLPDSMFSGCTGLTGDLRIPEGVTAIGSYVFYGCTGFNGTLTIPESVESASSKPFYNTNFTTIENNSTVTFNANDISLALNVSYGNEGVIGTGTYTRTEGDLIDISTAEITAPDLTYDGTVRTHVTWMGDNLKVRVNGTLLTKNTHYTVEYSNNVNAAAATSDTPPTVTITGLATGGLIGTRSQTFTIKPRSITPTVTLSQYNFIYDGEEKKPAVTVKDDSAVLGPENYDVEYANNTERGEASVTVTLKGNYTGNKTAYFYILDSQTITASDKTVKAGGTVSLDASTSGDGYLRYESSDPSVATVNENGIVTGIKEGTVTITIFASQTSTYNAATTTVTVTVGKSDQVISAANTSVQLGTTASLGATTSGDGELSYESSDPTVATVNANGIVTGVKPGAATITITASETDAYNEATKNVVVTVTAAATKGDQIITATNKSVAMGKTVSLDAKASDGGALTYASNNTGVARVNNSGVITPVSVGTTTITINAAATVSCNAASKTITVTVTKGVQVITASNTECVKGKTVKLPVERTGAGKLTYKSSKTNVATVSATGVVTGKKAGIAKITITAAADANWNKATKTVSVKVGKANPIKCKSKKATVAVNYSKGKAVTTALNVKTTKAKGALSYVNASVNATAKTFTVNTKTGKVTVPKATKKGKYRVIIKVAAKGNSSYISGSKTVKYFIKVK